MSERNLKRLGALTALMGQVQGPQVAQQEIDQRGRGQDLEFLSAILGINQRERAANAALEQDKLNAVMELQRDAIRRDLEQRKLDAENLRALTGAVPYMDQKLGEEIMALVYPEYVGKARTGMHQRAEAEARSNIAARLKGLDPKLRASQRGEFAEKGLGAIFDEELAKLPQPISDRPPVNIPFEQIYPLPEDSPGLPPEVWQRFVNPPKPTIPTLPTRAELIARSKTPSRKGFGDLYVEEEKTARQPKTRAEAAYRMRNRQP